VSLTLELLELLQLLELVLHHGVAWSLGLQQLVVVEHPHGLQGIQIQAWNPCSWLGESLHLK
jgi:hypothetical protein